MMQNAKFTAALPAEYQSDAVRILKSLQDTKSAVETALSNGATVMPDCVAELPKLVEAAKKSSALQRMIYTQM